MENTMAKPKTKIVKEKNFDWSLEDTLRDKVVDAIKSYSKDNDLYVMYTFTLHRIYKLKKPTK